jgi:hypothetical protein
MLMKNVEEAIDYVCNMIKSPQPKPLEIMQLSQAALNLAHTRNSIIHGSQEQNRK